MTYVLAVILGIVAAVVGWFVSGAIAVWIAGLYGMSDFEGGRGMFGFFFVGPLGGLVSMVTAAWLVLRAGKGSAPLGPTLGRVTIVLIAIASVVTAAILVRLYTIDTYTNELPPMLVFEMRLPATGSVPSRADTKVELHTDKNVGSGQLFGEWSLHGDYYVIAGGVDLAFKTTSRLLAVSVAGAPTRLFRLPLSRDPSSTPMPADWRRADHIDVAAEEQPRKAPADDPLEIRYRVRRAGDD